MGTLTGPRVGGYRSAEPVWTIGMRKGGKAAKWAARSERLSAALRENLKRRKAQARGRAAGTSGESAAADNAAAGCNHTAAGAAPPTPDFRRNRSNE